MALVDRPPICTHCGNEMIRLKRTTKKTHEPVYACAMGEPRKPPCDGDVARLGSRF